METKMTTQPPPQAKMTTRMTPMKTRMKKVTSLRTQPSQVVRLQLPKLPRATPSLKKMILLRSKKMFRSCLEDRYISHAVGALRTGRKVFDLMSYYGLVIVVMDSIDQ